MYLAYVNSIVRVYSLIDSSNLFVQSCNMQHFADSSATQHDVKLLLLFAISFPYHICVSFEYYIYIHTCNRRLVSDLQWLPPDAHINSRGQLLSPEHRDNQSHQFITIVSSTHTHKYAFLLILRSMCV